MRKRHLSRYLSTLSTLGASDTLIHIAIKEPKTLLGGIGKIHKILYKLINRQLQVMDGGLNHANKEALNHEGKLSVIIQVRPFFNSPFLFFLFSNSLFCSFREKCKFAKLFTMWNVSSVPVSAAVHAKFCAQLGRPAAVTLSTLALFGKRERER